MGLVHGEIHYVDENGASHVTPFDSDQVVIVNGNMRLGKDKDGRRVMMVEDHGPTLEEFRSHSPEERERRKAHPTSIHIGGGMPGWLEPQAT